MTLEIVIAGLAGLAYIALGVGIIRWSRRKARRAQFTAAVERACAQ
jgi:hypothetical protein